ncbi:DUF6059 family protein [Streptomyces sp. Da 82-17]|uniref:DUF6059 family protein n=1 Tax=Streptomyces sp. Da 82-17 TaxID=3377116 RepID=UPI0038D4EA0C
MSPRGLRRLLADRILHPLWEGLVSLGAVYLAGDTARADHDRTAPRPTGPAAHHPERLRPDLPLTPQERRLSRHLTRHGTRLD